MDPQSILTLGAYQGPRETFTFEILWWKTFWELFQFLNPAPDSPSAKQNNKQFWERSASPRLIKILTVDWCHFILIIGRGRALVTNLEKNWENNSSEEPQVFHSEVGVTENKIKWNEIRLAKLVVPKSCMLNFIWFDIPTLFLEEKE